MEIFLKDWLYKKMLAYPVGKGVNNPKNDNPECLIEIRDNA
jgi:hypothetical protein